MTSASELLKGAIRRAFTEHGVSSEDFIVSHGAQTAIGHELGFGEIAANEPVVIDLWPKDPESACYADMTRTFVVGTPPDELVEYYRLVKGERGPSGPGEHGWEDDLFAGLPG